MTLAALATNTGLTPLAVRQILDGKVSPRISNAMALSELGLELVLMPKTAAASFESKGGAHLLSPPERQLGAPSIGIVGDQNSEVKGGPMKYRALDVYLGRVDASGAARQKAISQRRN